jgi:hypothetical protein
MSSHGKLAKALPASPVRPHFGELCPLPPLYQHGLGPAGPGPDRGRGRQGKQEASKELDKDVRDFSGENLSEDRFY